MENKLEKCWNELLDLLETEEEGSFGQTFHPTTINSCRVMHTQKLREIFDTVKSELGRE